MEATKIIAQKAVLQKDNKLLILHRSENESAFPGLWDFPGGKLEKGENKEKSLIREVKEESQLTIRSTEILGTYYATLKNKPLEFIIYAANITDGTVAIGQEHSEFRWATPAKIKTLSAMPYMKKFLKHHFPAQCRKVFSRSK